MMEIVVVSLFIGFVGTLIALTVRGVRDDAAEEREQVHEMLQKMPREKADAWLRHPSLLGPRCACGTYNLKYTNTVKTDGGDHQVLRCQPARERIEINKPEGGV